jgi:hypothetical protein
MARTQATLMTSPLIAETLLHTGGTAQVRPSPSGAASTATIENA